MKTKQLTQTEINSILYHRFGDWNKERKRDFIELLVKQNQFEIIKEKLNSTMIKELFNQIYNGRVQYNNQKIESYKTQIKELKKKIKEDNAMINKLNQNL